MSRNTPPRLFPSLIPVKSYNSKADYIDEKGHEIRINRKNPTIKQTQHGRFTIFDETSPSTLERIKSYGDDADYTDEMGHEVRINRKNPNIKQTQKGRFTIVEDDTSPPTLERIKSYGDDADYIDERGHEVRINRKNPNIKQTQKGRFTIFEDDTSPPKPEPKKKSYDFYPGQKLGRFTIKSVTNIVPRSRSHSKSPKNRLISSPLVPRSRKLKFIDLTKVNYKSPQGPSVKIGRFRITKLKNLI